MIYPTRIYGFCDKNNWLIVIYLSSVIFKNKVREIRHDGNISKFRKFIPDPLINNNEDPKRIFWETDAITVELLQAENLFFIISYTLK